MTENNNNVLAFEATCNCFDISIILIYTLRVIKMSQLFSKIAMEALCLTTQYHLKTHQWITAHAT